MPDTPPRPGLLARVREASARALSRVARALTPVTLPPSPFEEWEYDDVESEMRRVLDEQTIDTSKSDPSGTASAPGDPSYSNPRASQDPIAVNREFYNGNHWMDGAGWIGPHPAIGDTNYVDGMNEIARAFTSSNKVKETTERHTLGLVGRSWQWAFVPRRALQKDEEPTDEEASAIEEATALVRAWLQARNIASFLRDVVITLLLSERSAIRLGVPPGLLVETDGGEMVVDVDTIEDALGMIWPYHPKPDDAAVVVDEDTKLECGVWLYEVAPERDAPDDEQPVDYAGLVYLDERRQTVIRLTPRDDEAANAAQADEHESTIDLGGRLTMFELKRRALITSQVQQQQRALNLAESMIPRNIVTGGFLERLILDGQMPGEVEYDENGVKTGRIIPKPFHVGAGTVNFIQATEHEDEQGSIVVGSPSVVYREPIKPDASIAASDKHYRSILDEVSQLHVIMNGDTDPSGKSRIEARAEYVKSLLLTQPEAESAIRFLIETALAMAETLSRQTGKYTSLLRVQAACRLDVGPLSPEERTAIENSIGKTISRETAMLMLQVDDIEAELARINGDRLARASLGKIVGEALGALTLPGATLEGAARFIGIDGKELDDLMTESDVPVPEPALDDNGDPIPPTDAPPDDSANVDDTQPPTRRNGSTRDNGNDGPSNRPARGGKTPAPARQTSSTSGSKT